MMKPSRIARAFAVCCALFAAVAPAQSHSEFVHHRHLRIDAPWGSSRVLVMYPRLPRHEAHPRGELWSVLVALHGQGEARRGPDRGFLAWSVDYHLPEAFGALATGRLIAEHFEGLVRAERLGQINRELARHAFRGFMVVCPYTPDLMSESPSSDRIREYGDWLAGPMLAAVRSELPAARGRAATAIDGVSLGGMLALETGFRHPEAFGVVSAMQPAVRGREREIAAIARHGAAQRIRLLTSDRDPFREPTTQLSRALLERQVPHDLTVVAGPHDYAFNRGPGSIEMLLFHDRALAREASSQP